MAWARVATGDIFAGATGDANVTSGTFDTTTATFIVAVASAFNAAPGITDNKGPNTYNELTGASKLSQGSGGYCSIFWSIPSSVGTGHTWTFTGGGNRYPSGVVFCFTGNNASPFGAEGGFSSASATSIQPGNLTPAEDSMLVIVGLAAYQMTTGYTIDSGWTQIGVYSVGAQHVASSIAFQIQTTATAVNPTQSWSSGAAVCAANIATFKIPAAGGQPAMRRFGKSQNGLWVPHGVKGVELFGPHAQYGLKRAA